MEKIKIEDILSKIYAQPDLKGGVFNFINPIILKANKYFQENKLDIEQKHALENLLFKEIPQLVDTYTKLPITYRNEKKVKAGKTHRDMLISNFELLGQNFLNIESDIYAAIDMEASVQTRVIQNKYQTPILMEVDYAPQKVEDDFQWDNVKDQYKEVLPEETMNKIFLKERVKKENVKNIIAEQETIKKEKKPTLTPEELGEIIGGFIIIGIFCSVLGFISNMIYHAAIDNNRAEELDQIGQMIIMGKGKLSKESAESNLTNEATLKLIKNFAEKNKITIEQKNDRILATNNQNNEECEESLKISNFYHSDIQSITINGLVFKDLTQTYKMTSDMKAATCNLPKNNIVTATFKFE